MSKLSNLIFHNSEHYITSPFGYRQSFSTSAGATSYYHSGVDYGTNGEKKPQYAIADGKVLSCGIDSAYGGAKYVWVSYPALGVKMLHYHLDAIKVKTGQSVNKNTVLGTTGMTGKATGVHLHLGLKYLSGGDYIDPEKWSKDVLEKTGYTAGDYKVVKVTKAGVLRIRKGAGKMYAAKKFAQLTEDAQKKILKASGKKMDGYVKGMEFTATQIKGNWGKTPSGWIYLKYCERI